VEAGKHGTDARVAHRPIPAPDELTVAAGKKTPAEIDNISGPLSGHFARGPHDEVFDVERLLNISTPALPVTRYTLPVLQI
jgi:hypothetical protein